MLMTPQCIIQGDRACSYCQKGFSPKRAWSAFCSDKCRSAYDTDIGMSGKVNHIRKLSTGTVSVTVHLKGPAAERALNLEIGEAARLVKLP